MQSMMSMSEAEPFKLDTSRLKTNKSQSKEIESQIGSIIGVSAAQSMINGQNSDKDSSYSQENSSLTSMKSQYSLIIT